MRTFIIPDYFLVDHLHASRDWLIGNITQTSIPTGNLTSNLTYQSTTSFNNFTYHSNIQYVPGLLPNTNFAINHNLSVGIDGINACDGFVAVVDIQITAAPAFSYVIPCVSNVTLSN